VGPESEAFVAFALTGGETEYNFVFMRSGPAILQSRRTLLRFLLGSPLLLAARPMAAAEELLEAIAQCEPDLSPVGELITSPEGAINVFDFQAVARQKLSPGHYAYLATGVDHERGLHANRAGFGRFGLRPRRMIDVTDLDTSIEVLGAKLASPIVLAPAGMQSAFHPDAEVAVARAARDADWLQILSTASSKSLDEVVDARGGPVWAMIVAPRFWPLTRWQLRRAEDAGCPVVVITVDYVGFGSQDRLRHFRGPGGMFRTRENPTCEGCHGSGELVRVGKVLTWFGRDLVELASDLLTLDWDIVDRIRDATSMKVVLKGILTHEDAALAVEHGVDGIIVSNHGARQIDNSLSTIEVLPEIVRAVDGHIPVLIDSGFRRGTDVFTALALGASAVCIGRPYLWGLSAFGEEGVAGVLTVLRREFETVMRHMGTRDIASITADFAAGPRSASDLSGTARA
jgi:isopentenyl diphosphate isomerase/L-lactate dehydrogenase-like FMN-dependent dehydrogenase